MLGSRHLDGEPALPPRLTGCGAGAPGARGGSGSRLGQAGSGWLGAQGTRQAGGRRVAQDDWASQPSLIALGAGCVWGPSPDGPGLREVLPPACLCHVFKPLSSLPLLVYPHLCVHSPVCPHPESLFPAFTTFPYLCVCHSSLCVPVCLCACLSLSLSPCFPLPVSFSASLCLCFPPSVSLSEPLSFHPMSQSVPPVPAPPSPLLEPRWAPGLLWAPPFSIPRSRGKLGRHRGGAAAWWRGRTEG